MGVYWYASLYQTMASISDIRALMSSAPSLCSKKLNFFFLKNPKCGSGTTMNILQQFVMSHSLNAILNKEGNHFYKPYIKVNDIIPLPDNETYNAFYLHVHYSENKDLFEQFLPNDTFYFSIIREPLKRLSSYLLYSNWYSKARAHSTKNKTDEELVLDYVDGKIISPTVKSNEQIHYHGYHQASSNKPEYLDEFIIKTFQRFDFIMITEYFDESLVLLRRYMCWELKDILYTTAAHEQNYTVHGANLSHPTIYKWIVEHNKEDFVFYERSLSVFNRRVSAEGPGFRKEVQAFKTLINSVSSFCAIVNNLEKELQVSKSEWTPGFVIVRNDCNSYMTEPSSMIGIVKNFMMYKYIANSNDPNL